MSKPHPIFDAPGPQLASLEAGPEPTLRTVLVVYYASSGIPAAKTKKLVKDYIKHWRQLT